MNILVQFRAEELDGDGKTFGTKPEFISGVEKWTIGGPAEDNILHVWGPDDTLLASFQYWQFVKKV